MPRPASSLRFCLAGLSLAVGLLVCSWSSTYAADETTLSNDRFFESYVRPILVEKCQKCHGSEKSKGGLRLDSLASLLAGGESGPAIVPHKPDESLLIEAVRYNSLEMPPDGALPEEEVVRLVKWVELGAPWPGSPAAPAPLTGGAISDADRDFWSFQPLCTADVPVGNDWCRNDIDGFILRRLEEQGLQPAPEADRQTLIRRLSFDLTGLPPTAAEVDEFVQDSDPRAYERVVERLLASPRYGEHWAAFWLDLVRYAESDGFRKDDYRPEAWRYRDYVISSLNEDIPYSEFISEQLAGDEIAPGDPRALAATGFLRHGIYEYNQRDARQQWQDILNDITDTVGDVFLGVGMGCARCHDHKFDPILQKDYFRLQAFFANLAFRDDVPLASAEEIGAWQRQQQAWEEATRDVREQIREIEQPLLDSLAADARGRFPADIKEMVAKPENERTSDERQLCYLVELQVQELQSTLPSKLKGEEKDRWEKLRGELAAFDSLKPPPLPMGRTVSDYGAQAPAVFITGKQRLGEVAPGFLTIFDAAPASLVSVEAVPETTGRRSTLAAWLTRDDHPLVTRVIVNRIWNEHFGRGIVGTPSDFGHLGETPSHPELLDWLARQFVENGWSFKWLHRQIVQSATYRQTSLRKNEVAERLDPENRWLWRFNVRRLTAEEIHDALFAVSGELDLSGGGPSSDPAKSRRRAIFNKVLRNSPDPVLATFDFPDRMVSSAGRNITTSPAQSLLLINGEFSLKRATALASRIREGQDEVTPATVSTLYRTVLGRDCRPDEQKRIERFLEAADSPDPLLDLCHVLLNSNEFIYRD